ncbi:MAG: hypothetical protein GY898_01345 [Proteobacteria bacterium]|nr:hypothetical protein [Pseudomonadota bacterium]
MKRALLPLLAAACLLPAPGAADRGELRIEGLELRSRSWEQMEAGALGSPPEELRAWSSRHSAWLIVANTRDDWDRQVAPLIRQHLGTGGGPDALGDALAQLPSSIQVSGPDLDGGLVRLDLPGKRGRAYVAVALPRLLKRGRDAAAVLNSKRPNVGLFVAGADVRPEDRDADGERLIAMYVPSRPKPLTGGLPAPVEIRQLPKKGRGALGVFGGRGGGGEDAELIVRDLKRFVGRDFLDAEMMRSFPKKGDLSSSLRTIRVKGEVLVRDDDWYRTLAADPSSWTFERGAARHAARYLATSAPVVTVVDDGTQQQREVIVGIVATYAPLLLTPDEAPPYAGTDARTFYEAVQGGEIPFLRVESEVLFYRPWVDRWADGKARRPSGRAMTYATAKKQAFGWADRIRSRSLDKAARGPLPFRMEPIPEDELAEMVDRSRRYRGRVFKDDLGEWLGHFDADLDAGDLDTSWSMAARGDVARFRAEWADVPTTTGTAVALGGTGATAPPPRSSDGPKKAPPARTADSTSLDDLGLGGDRGWETGDSDDGGDGAAEAATPAASEAEDDFDFDDLGSGGEPVPIGTGSWNEYGGSGGGPARLTRLDILDFYVGSCRPGDALDAAVEFTLDGLAEGELAELTVEWDFYVDGRNVKRDSSTVAREAGPQEVELEVICPSQTGAGELQVLLVWADKELQAEGATDVAVRGSTRRTYAKLSMPSAKRCLTSLTGDDSGDDYGMQLEVGLDGEQISSSVRGFQEQTLRCHPEDGEVTGQVNLEISVGCDGRVKNVTVLDDDTGDSAFAQCVADTMGFCPFDAHARDEVIFELPLRYE